MDIDFGRTAADYSRHRAGFPEEFYRRIASFGVGTAGQQLLDIGTGTGTLARGFAQRGCQVTGLDPAAPLLQAARGLDTEAGVTVQYTVARAEETGLRSASFDVVTAGQCWHWFDRAAAAQEVARVLVPGGTLVIAHFDWIPLPGNVVEATEQLIEHHNPEWNMGGWDGVHSAWLYDVATAGFHDIETFSFDLYVPYSHEAWRGRIRASAGIAASLSAEQVAAFDAELAALLRERFAADPVHTLHRVFAVVCRKKGIGTGG